MFGLNYRIVIALPPIRIIVLASLVGLRTRLMVPSPIPKRKVGVLTPPKPVHIPVSNLAKKQQPI